MDKLKFRAFYKANQICEVLTLDIIDGKSTCK